MGGLSRRAYQIKEIRSKENKPVILLDGGSLLFAKPVIAESLKASKRVQAEGILRAMHKMSYDAVGIAPLDLTVGFDFLAQQAEKNQLPWLSANLKPKTAAPFFKPYIIKQVGEISVAVINMTGEQNKKNSEEAAYRISNWSPLLPEIITEIEPRADMIILLSSYPESVNRQIAGQLQGIHLIIESGQATSNKPPELVGNTLITRIGSRGKYMGRMDIRWHDSKQWQQDFQSLLHLAQNQLNRTNWLKARMERQAAGPALQQSQAYNKLLRDQADAQAEITRIKDAIAKEQGTSATFSHSFIALLKSLPEDPAVKEIVAQTKKAQNALGRKQLTRLSPASESGRKIMQKNMAGSVKCQGCHPVQTEFWEGTRHAEAWQTLINVSQQFNRKCIICHVTLPTYNQDKVAEQNLLVNLPKVFHNVGCESCHGPGSSHAENPGKIRPPRTTTKICLACHTPDHDNMFVFKVKRSSIACPKNSN